MSKRVSYKTVASTYSEALYEAEKSGHSDPREYASAYAEATYPHISISTLTKGIKEGRKNTVLHIEQLKSSLKLS